MCLCHEDGDWRSYSRGDGEYDTNQQLEFELDEFGQRLFVGSNEEGMVKIYDVTCGSGRLFKLIIDPLLRKLDNPDLTNICNATQGRYQAHGF